MSHEAKRVLLLSNYLLSGFNVNLDDVDAEMAYYVQYFTMKRRSKEEETKFVALAEMLKKLFGK